MNTVLAKQSQLADCFNSPIVNESNITMQVILIMTTKRVGYIEHEETTRII